MPPRRAGALGEVLGEGGDGGMQARRAWRGGGCQGQVARLARQR